MKAIMISIKPKYVADILNGKKTIEIRKTLPKCDLPIDVYIYCTKSNKDFAINYGDRVCLTPTDDLSLLKEGITTLLNGKVVAKFTLNMVEYCKDTFIFSDEEYDLEPTCLTAKEIQDYGKSVYAWHIDNLEIFDKPKELSEFKVRRNDCPFPCDICDVGYCKLKRPPQSWQFIEI